MTELFCGRLKVGKRYFIQTIPYYYVGRVVSYDKDKIVLTGATLVWDTGRFSKAMQTHTFAKVQKREGNIAIPISPQTLPKVGTSNVLHFVEWPEETPAPGQFVFDLKDLKVGESYFIRANPYFYTGELVTFDSNTMVLKKAAWIPTEGNGLKTGMFDEVEPYPADMEVTIIVCDPGVEIFKWSFPLPRAPH